MLRLYVFRLFVRGGEFLEADVARWEMIGFLMRHQFPI